MRQSKLQHYWEWSEYGEESWKLEVTCCHSKSSEKPAAKTSVKNSQSVNNNNNNNNNNNDKDNSVEVLANSIDNIHQGRQSKW